MRLLLLLAACGGDPDPTAPSDGPDETGLETASSPPDVLCEPVATPSQPHFVEGDLVSGTFACATGAPREDLELRLIRGPDGATLDPEAWTVTFPTDLASAGFLSVYVEVAGGQALPEATEWIVPVADAGPGVKGNAPVDPATYTEELGLPVLHCAADAAITESYVGADCWLDGEAYPEAQIKIRGAASASYPKTSFTLEFPGDKLDGEVLGLPGKGHLVLISTFDDNSYVRQKLIYDLWSAIAAHLQDDDRVLLQTSFVVLYLNGAYHGLYVSVDHVDDELFEEHGLSDLGNVYKSVSHDANFTRTLASGQPKTDLSAGWEKKEGAPPTDFSDLEALTAFVADSDPKTFAAELAQRVDLEEFLDWWILVTYTASGDSAGKNAYVYNDPVLPPFRYVPWDFNHSWGQSWTTERVAVETWDDYRGMNGIFDRVLADPALSAELMARTEALLQPGGPLTAAWQLDQLQVYYDLIGPSADRDWSVWADDYASYSRWAHRTDFTDPAGERAYLEGWIAAREAVFRTATGAP